jgi:single-strand DNA-binding protein
MAVNINRVILGGNLTRDPELRYISTGRAVAQVGIAINHVYTTESGERREDVTFVDIEAWGKTAETMGQYLKKGRPVLVEGRLKLDTWDDKQTNQKRSKLKVVCDRFHFLDSGGNRSGEAGAAATPRPEKPAAGASPAPEPDEPPAEPHDDVPF